MLQILADHIRTVINAHESCIEYHVIVQRIADVLVK